MISPSLTERAVNPREIATPFGAILRSAAPERGYTQEFPLLLGC
jgi:hypothetical protein